MARCDGDVGANRGGPSLLLRQTGSGSEFPVFTSDSAIETAFVGDCAHGAAFGDYDRDGNIDLFVAMTGPDRLYRNDGDGTFTDVTGIAGVAGPVGDTDDVNVGGYWVDVNRDGLLDLVVPAHAPSSPPSPDPLNANRLYINRGDGGFSSVGDLTGIEGNGSTQSAAIADLDGDSDLEIYLANDTFYIEGVGMEVGLDTDRWLDVVSYDANGVPRYTDLSAQYGLSAPRSSMGIAIADINRDGHDDIYVADFGANELHLWNPAQARYNEDAEGWNLELFEAPLLGLMVAWDVVFTDLDRDGSLDLIVIHGATILPRECDHYTQFDAVMRYDSDQARFVEITSEVGLPLDMVCPPQDDRPLTGRGLVLADLDGDLDDDLIVTPYVEKYRVYRNDTPQERRHFLRIEPRGTVSAPQPYGAIVEVVRTDDSILRRNLYAGGTNTQRYPRFDIGLGSDTAIKSATLHWPSGYSQRIDRSPEFALDRVLAIAEPEWLSVSARVMEASDTEPPVLTYRPVDSSGAFLGDAAKDRTVTVTRAGLPDLPMSYDDQNDRFTVDLPRPATAGIIEVSVTDAMASETPLRPRFWIDYR